MPRYDSNPSIPDHVSAFIRHYVVLRKAWSAPMQKQSNLCFWRSDVRSTGPNCLENRVDIRSTGSLKSSEQDGKDWLPYIVGLRPA